MRALFNYFQSQTIHIKVLVFGVVMSSIPLLLISSCYYFYVKSDLETRIYEKQNLVLESLSHEIEADFTQIFQSSHVLASLLQVDQGESAFYELLQNESIEEAVVTNEKGFVVKRVSRYSLNLPGENERWFTDDMWFKLQTEDQVFGEVEFNQYGQPVMKLAVPFYENNRKKAIGVVVQLQKLIGKISSLRQDDSSYIYLLDRNGRIIAHQDYSKLWQKQPLVQNQNVLGVRAKINQINWELVMEQPKATAFEPINSMLQNGLAAVALVILTVSLISISAGLYFTRPIVQIDREMNRLKQGRNTRTIDIDRKDELGKLVITFNSMSKELLEKSKLLEQEKERLNVVVNGIGSGLALVTKDYSITWMNPILKSWLQEDRLTLPCYASIGGEDSPCQDCPITCSNLTGNVEKLMKIKDYHSAERIFRHRVFELNHAIEEQGEFLVVLEDITEQKQMEERIVQTDKLSALGIMASSFAHEVNNPLTTINVYAEDMMDRIQIDDETLDAEEMEYYLGKIKENTQRCKKITSNLLNFSRKADWTNEVINIKKTIEDSVSLVEYQLRKNRIQLELDVEKGLPPVIGDGLKLMQVLVNLINNAVGAMELEGNLVISATLVEQEILIKVIDNGHGISEDVMDKLFDPFFTTKPVGKGTGLGLSVCYGIIQQFGGNIEITSTLGEGTTIIIRLLAAIGTEGYHDENKAISCG
ncbi:PAS domain-containing sensor histidine kinase [Neobacillus niacini]|uniref:PAS domain-containing sensor histidine kinase n=1 Tax=Neobacillus niacini TaxID=86668 RepID=UPI001EE72951|nr:PAS domain-containing sensor histidine kinase [Neobacillus niacini]